MSRNGWSCSIDAIALQITRSTSVYVVFTVNQWIKREQYSVPNIEIQFTANR